MQIVQPLEYLSLQVVWRYSWPNGPPGMAGHDTVWHGGAVVPCLIVSPCRSLDPGTTLWSVSRADERGSSSCHPVRARSKPCAASSQHSKPELLVVLLSSSLHKSSGTHHHHRLRALLTMLTVARCHHRARMLPSRVSSTS